MVSADIQEEGVWKKKHKEKAVNRTLPHEVMQIANLQSQLYSLKKW